MKIYKSRYWNIPEFRDHWGEVNKQNYVKRNLKRFFTRNGMPLGK